MGRGALSNVCPGRIHHSNRNARVASVVTEVVPTTSGENQGIEEQWFSLQRERLAAAETISGTLSGEPLIRQRRHIASLKRNLTLGPAGLRVAAIKAAQSRSN